eukprot:scaffold74345_cov37-Tisochrysis_lutea.AAC.2
MCFEKAAGCHLKCDSPHEAATAYTEAANCYKKTDAKSTRGSPGQLSAKAPCSMPRSQLYLPSRPQWLSCSTRRRSGSRLIWAASKRPQNCRRKSLSSTRLRATCSSQHNSETGAPLVTLSRAQAMEAFQTAADYYQGEESTTQANQCLLKVAGFAATSNDFKKAVEIYEQVAISSLESNLLKWSVKDYFLRAGICHLAGGEAGTAVSAVERYKSLDASFEGTREGTFLEAITRAYEAADADAFTDLVREYDEVSRLDPQKTSLLLEVKNKIKAQVNDLT